MLPSRLFRNIGIPPALRSLVTPHASLPSTISVQLRLRLGVIPGSVPNAQGTLGTKAAFSTSASKFNTPTKAMQPPASSTPDQAKDSSSSSTDSESVPTTTSQALPEKMAPKLSLTFTCTVAGCGERSTHQFTKNAYEKGVVLVECPGCKNKHLIADHLGWFKESTKDGKLPTVEDILRDKGEKVRRGVTSANGDLEFVES